MIPKHLLESNNLTYTSLLGISALAVVRLAVYDEITGVYAAAGFWLLADGLNTIAVAIYNRENSPLAQLPKPADPAPALLPSTDVSEHVNLVDGDAAADPALLPLIISYSPYSVEISP